MTQFEFISLCGEYSILPALALESEDLKKALRSKDDQEVKRILLEDF